jgi:maltose alpha-D-glucosyltransferase / alpha-amylase
MSNPRANLENNILWYKDAIIYQLHVKTFCDADGDGIGDFKGLKQKLSYLRDLGVSVIWLLPFYPSPLKDDGYDIADYYDVHPNYGTMKDFKDFLREAHQKGLRVITELVINHTSDQHPWFLRAKKSKKGSTYRDYYVWSDTKDKYKDARIIFKDFEASNWAWSEEAKSYYWHRFYSHQPDLNFDNPSVQKEIFRIADFWLSMGVDGLRLDAVPYLFEREGTNCENLPETHDFLKKLRKQIESKYKNRMLLAEANQWPEDAVQYFGRGNECHMAFHFPLMPRMYMSVEMEDRFPIIDILEQTPKIPRWCQWAIFLRNHDELTLEMVTDEERDYMYRTYAKDTRSKINLGIRRRLLPLIDNDRRKFELMNVLLFSLPGTPVVYYGDEIGMGDNRFLGDRDGVRTPMQWSPDRNAGFSKANPQELYLPIIIEPEYHYETTNVETQEKNVSSLLWWMKRLINMRKRFKAFSRGTIKFLSTDNSKVMTFIREHHKETILVVINLSRFAQTVDMDLKEYEGFVPEEVFSQNDFSVIKDSPYTITLGPHNHFWFLLKKQETSMIETLQKTPKIRLEKSWEELFSPELQRKMEAELLPQYLKKSRWFGGKARNVRSVRIVESIDLNHSDIKLLILNVSYFMGSSESYLLPLSFVYRTEDKKIASDFPESIVSRLYINKREAFLYDAVYNEKFHKIFLETIAHSKKIKSKNYTFVGRPGKKFKTLINKNNINIPSNILKVEQSNTSVIFKDVFFMKVFRKLEEGLNPDIEVTKYLTEKKDPANVPTYAGHVEISRTSKAPISLCILQKYIASEASAWTYAQDNIKHFFDMILSKAQELKSSDEQNKDQENPDNKTGTSSEHKIVKSLKMGKFIGTLFLEMVALLGKRTGEMHLKLSEGVDNPDFKPESFSLLHQRAIYQSFGSQARFVFRLLKKQLSKLPENIQKNALEVLALEKDINKRFKLILQKKYSAKKIRIHGDYHLGQVLFTGKDFTIIDFEGEPARALSERCLKKLALKDIAGMLRSFHYAAYSTLLFQKSVRDDDIALLELASDFWCSKVSSVFIASYFETVGKAEFLPKTSKELVSLLQSYLLDKAIYELGYELNNRPDWVLVPLKGIKQVLNNFKIPKLVKDK